IGDVENPTYKQMRDVTEEHKDRELVLGVLRADAKGVERKVLVTVVPERRSGRVLIGIVVTLDAEHTVVAKTIPVQGKLEALAIPSGARITKIGGKKVSNFYDISRQIKLNSGKRVTIAYRLDNNKKGGIAVDIGDAESFITAKPSLAEFIPFRMSERLYKASGPINAIGMGYRKTYMFVAQTYVTLKLLVSGLVSTKDLMGPVGILTFSYKIVAEQPFIYYVYFLGLISACIAVFNFLPLPPLDGGHMILLLIEKIKGSALSERVHAAVAYAGWVLIGSFFLYVTFNDIVKGFFS
ncbi:MAG: site-2 protease family protein, partial [Planctomycetes bacterium]|nr:site-2 protease family protein [Planctomycetota bacterium]